AQEYLIFTARGVPDSNNDFTSAGFHSFSLSGNQGYLLRGNPIGLGAGGIDASAPGFSATYTVAMGLTLTAPQTFTVGQNITLIVSGPIANRGFLVTIAGAGTSSLAGLSGTGGLSKQGAGTLSL